MWRWGDCARFYTYYIEETGAAPGQYTTYYGTVNDGTVTKEDGLNYAKNGQVIINLEASGYELPSSGGRGTTWIYLLGTVLLLGCGTILIARRRVRQH